MATDKRSYPNSYFAWYNDDERLALVCKVISNDVSDTTETTIDKYDTYSGSSVTGGLRIHTHSKYGKVEEVTDDLKVNSGLDTSLHSSIIDYVKSRLLEDMGDLQRAGYYRSKYERTIKQYPHRKSGVRALSVPRM
jgi:hypothetical protein|tara:strand:+ start:1006 stop:1413 length:408 start_codon:yes stop_codon:yes gene_type:complete